MPFLLILLTRSRYRRLSRLLSLSLSHLSITLKLCQVVVIFSVAAYTLYYHTTPAVETPAIHPSRHDPLSVHLVHPLCFFDNYLPFFNPLLHFLHYCPVFSFFVPKYNIFILWKSLLFTSFGSRHYFTLLAGTSPHPARHKVQTRTKRQTWDPSTPSRTSSTLPPTHHFGTTSSLTIPRF